MRIVAAIAAVSFVAACNPAAPGGDVSTSAAPNPAAIANASYRLEANHTDGDGKVSPIVMVRDGGKMRIEMMSDNGPATIIVDRDKGEAFTVASMGGRQMAMRMPVGDDMPGGLDALTQDFTADAGQQVGVCNVAGETGAEYERTEEDGTVERGCVTTDGVILRASSNGAVTWEATSVSRGPQPANHFTLPEGVQVMDMGAMGDAAAEAMAKMKAQTGQ
jgi:hypothetical protein